MLEKIAPIAKAVTAAIIAFLTAILTGLDDRSIDLQEIVVGLIAFFSALGVVWYVPNKQENLNSKG